MPLRHLFFVHQSRLFPAGFLFPIAALISSGARLPFGREEFQRIIGFQEAFRVLISTSCATETFNAMTSLIRKPLSRRRIWLAIAVAIIADGIQLFLGPFGWTFVDQAIDVLAMILLCLLLGFHPLFLPTFIAEFFPVTDMLPSWTACTAVVIALRRKQQRPDPSSVASSSKVIDI
jgi:hypothetical protein